VKSILEGPKKVKAKEQEYPVLKIHLNPGRVVLFTTRGTGTLIHDPTEEFPIGHSTDDWIEHMFVPLKGKIILSN
jgi:hypothetical protein